MRRDGQSWTWRSPDGRIHESRRCDTRRVLTDDLRRAVAALALEPRQRVWTSLTYCVLDAVWSIGARYDSVVVPLVGRVAAARGDSEPSVVPERLGKSDPFPLDELLATYPDPDALVAITNRQRTSTRGGILKADAALRYAGVLRDHGVTQRADVSALAGDVERSDQVDRALARVPGDGVRRGYLWMLAGSDDIVKPDRMVLRFLARHGCPATPSEARVVLAKLADDLSEPCRPVTPWMVDHAIWKAQRRASA